MWLVRSAKKKLVLPRLTAVKKATPRPRQALQRHHKAISTANIGQYTCITVQPAQHYHVAYEMAGTQIVKSVLDTHLSRMVLVHAMHQIRCAACMWYRRTAQGRTCHRPAAW